MIYTLKKIETPHLIIRPVAVGDEIPLNKAINHSLAILKKWAAWAKDTSLDTTRGFVMQAVFSRKSASVIDFPMVLIHKGDQKIIGATGYNDRSDMIQGLYEIGYWCDVDYQGQGLVTECANALTRYAFEALRAAKVIISMQVDNKKSIGVAERLAFLNEGITDRDPHDCVSDQPEKNYIYACRSTNNLPSLKVSWEHNTEENTDAKIIAWAKDTLNITDNKAFATSRVIISAPWSTVLEINTGNTLVYLKQMPEALALEPTIIQTLFDQFQASVPEVIGHNPELHCFLMKDAGRPLREILKRQFNSALYCKAINAFTSMQLATADHVTIFLDMGVPDWRLDTFPDVYRHLLTQREILLADGLSEKEILELVALQPILRTLCQTLSNYGIKPSIVQPDFQDNNILIDEKSQNITLVDLGEIVISHPFFSLSCCLEQTIRHHSLTKEDNAYKKLQDACLKNFTNFDTKNNLLEAFAIAGQLKYIYQALSYYRLMLACDKTTLHALYGKGRLSRPLKTFITVCKQI